MFSSIKAYIAGAFIALLAYLKIRNSMLESENENLQEENAAHEKIEEITSTMEKAQAKAEEIEKQAKKDFDDKDWRNKI